MEMPELRVVVANESHLDALSSDCVWFLIAFYRDQPAGLAILARTPKLDARLGFLYLDELYVMHEFRPPASAGHCSGAASS